MRGKLLVSLPQCVIFVSISACQILIIMTFQRCTDSSKTEVLS